MSTPAERWEALSKAEGARKQALPQEFVDMPDFPCTCGSTRRVCIAVIQLRSADELASSFYMCDRGHRVRYN